MEDNGVKPPVSNQWSRGRPQGWPRTTNMDGGWIMQWIELIGYCGTVLTIIAYAMRTSIRLRIAGILSSVAFLAYGYLTASYPVMLMEVILLPLNVIRLVEMLLLVRSVAARRAEGGGEVTLDWLLPHMTRLHLACGAALFRQGDEADTLYILMEGELRHAETGEGILPGALVGDTLLFEDAGRQSTTVVAETRALVAALPQSALNELYFQNPAFGYQLVRLLLTSLRAEVDAMRHTRPAASRVRPSRAAFSSAS